MTSTSICKRISSATATTATTKAVSTSSSSQGSSVICEEVFDEACFPSSEEINEYASLIGIEPQREQHLLYLAKEGLMAALPSDWKICYSEEKNGHYYYNTRTKESQWDHPLDAIYRNLVNQARQKQLETGSVVENVQFVDTSDEMSQLDSGIKSMQGIDDIPSPGPLPSSNLSRKWSIASKASFLTPSLLSDGKSRFLDSRTKDLGRFYHLGFEVTKSKPQIATKPTINGKSESFEGNEELGKLTATVSMFQKARRQLESDGYTSPSGVKGILRDSSITDISRRLDRLEPTVEVEDKKSVRFNLDQAERMKDPSEETLSTKMTKSYKQNLEDDHNDVQVVVEDHNDDDGDDGNGDEEASKDEAADLWHKQNVDMYNRNPFLLDSNKSMEKSPEHMKTTGTGEASEDKSKETDTPKLFYDDTDSDSKGSSVRSFIVNKSEQDSSILAGNNAFDLEELSGKHSFELDPLQLKSVQIDTDKSVVSNSTHLPIFSDTTASEVQLQNDFETIRHDYEAKLKRFRHEYDLRLTSHQHKLEEAFELQIEKYRVQLERQLQNKRSLVVSEHKTRIETLQSNHEEILRDLERELHNEEEILRREQASRLSQLRDKFARELDSEKLRFREKGEERLYEKVRCEKRLLEDKYRCLKEKYVRLKTDVKLSLERRNRRREAQMVPQHNHTNSTKSTSGTEMERSMERYYKTQSGNSDNRSLSYSDQAIAGDATVKPPVPHKSQLTKTYNIRQLQLQDDNTSMSQSDTTLSNTYNNGRYGPFLKSASGVLSARTVSDNGNSSRDIVGAVAIQSNLEKNNNSNQIKETTGISRIFFSRTKSASTSRLNSDTSYKGERPCTPVENLRHQLQKLEALEDQFPENTSDAPYHLRYPFTDISVKPNGVGSELEFFKHRIHLERDSVRRAKESLRTQRTNFRLRQREISQQRKITTLSPKLSIDQLIQEEKELTEMEVNLHRTRSLLGEKIIRLRHLEQSLLRIYEKEKSILDLGTIDDAATLSDLSSHSSSGFSSTELASAADFHKKKDYYQQESNECIENLEILNAEIREILDIFGQKQYQQQQHEQSASAIPALSPRDIGWSQVLKHQQSTTQNFSLSDDIEGGGAVHIPHSIPTLADRLETYRQLAAGRMQSSMGAAILTANTIVSQSPRAVNYTTCLVERTRDLRNWLRQAKTEHEFMVQHGISSGQGSVVGEVSASITGHCASSGSGSIINATTAGSSMRGKNDI
ncbi:centrosomal protein of 164 kDa [Drosophila eugracilis]|uniref:centrosomal protein of 164 kDa n=1 Tax=Drosophila eugracilis TaxID=29029 RepID=UPI0007E6EF38|nr:centrosomal protein of 164 kDa [Drosophila eugracilis]XP_017066794.1 centrosomal protein of 164 kDa [Drosophila eugracilis]